VKKTSPPWMDWLIIVIAFAAFWPVGAFLLFGKLSGQKKPAKKSYNQEYEYHYQKQDLKQHQKAASASNSGKTAKKDVGRKMTIGGGIAAGVFGITFVSTLLDYISWGGLQYAWSELFWMLGLCAAGLVTMFAGIFRTRKGKRYQKYLSLIGKRRQIPVTALAKAAGVSQKKVYDDLEDMLEQGLIPVGYLDRSRGLLVLSADGLQDEPVKETTKKNVSQQPHTILQEIRQINDEIADPDMSAKIERIEMITGKILDYQKKNPGRDSELRSFLDYYLPTTLKILRSYAQLEAQGIEGENIRTAKVRIEGMMDKVVEGFETQLDKLFQSDTMDITSDVDVLEQMLKKDGLSDGEGLTL